jgi:hypothetical protein
MTNVSITARVESFNSFHIDSCSCARGSEDIFQQDSSKNILIIYYFPLLFNHQMRYQQKVMQENAQRKNDMYEDTQKLLTSSLGAGKVSFQFPLSAIYCGNIIHNVHSIHSIGSSNVR